jgi:hypothetical protein
MHAATALLVQGKLGRGQHRASLLIPVRHRLPVDALACGAHGSGFGTLLANG